MSDLDKLQYSQGELSEKMNLENAQHRKNLSEMQTNMKKELRTLQDKMKEKAKQAALQM